jgi:hypothetical protein
MPNICYTVLEEKVLITYTMEEDGGNKVSSSDKNDAI